LFVSTRDSSNREAMLYQFNNNMHDAENWWRGNLHERIIFTVFLLSRTYQVYFSRCIGSTFPFDVCGCSKLQNNTHGIPRTSHHRFIPSLLRKHSYNMDTSTTSTVATASCLPSAVCLRSSVLLVVENAVLFSPPPRSYIIYPS